LTNVNILSKLLVTVCQMRQYRGDANNFCMKLLP